MSGLDAAAERVRADGEPSRRIAVTAVALALVAGLAGLDAAWSRNIETTVVIAPFLAALAANVRQTAAVAVVALGSALLSGAWNDDFGDAAYVVRGVVVLAGGLFAVLAARRQDRAAIAEGLGLQLTAALSNLAEAVIVQDEDRRLLYANEAAAETLGFPSVEFMLSTPLDELAGENELYLEDGTRVKPEQYPSRRVLDGEDPGPVTMRVVNRATGEERWRVTKARAVANSRGQPKLVVSVVEDITEAKRTELGQRLLARAGRVLASSVDYERTLQDVARLAVPELADWCGVSMPDRNGVIQQVAVAHVDPQKVAFARDYSRRYPQYTSDEGGAAQVLRDGQPLLVAEIPDELLEQAVEDPEQRELLRSIGMRSAISVPMVPTAGRPIGVLSLVNAESGRVFTQSDLEVCMEIGRRAGIAVENARLYAQRSQIARTLQRALLPPALPEIPGFSLAALYRPAGRENWVGGDFYDAFRVDDGWMVVVGDVAGRGASAASLTAFSRHVLRTSAQLLPDPLDAIAFLNRQLYERPGSALCTICCVVLRERGDETHATVVCAGHPRPFMVRRDGRAEPVGRWGQMLGAWTKGEFPRTDTTLAPGEILVIYTDGVTDTVGEGERFGDDRLRETVAAARSADDALRRIEDALVEFEQGDQADDTAALAIARERRAGEREPDTQLGSAA